MPLTNPPANPPAHRPASFLVDLLPIAASLAVILSGMTIGTLYRASDHARVDGPSFLFGLLIALVVSMARDRKVIHILFFLIPMLAVVLLNLALLPFSVLCYPMLTLPGLVVALGLPFCSHEKLKRWYALPITLGVLYLLVFPLVAIRSGPSAYFPWLLSCVALLIWFVYMIGYPYRKQPHPMTLLVVGLTFLTMPISIYRWLVANPADFETIASQPGVEAVFGNDRPGEIPAWRMELLCEPQTGTLIVSPHSPLDWAALIDPNGAITKIDLRAEASNKTFFHEGRWYVVAKGHLTLVDVAQKEIHSRTPIPRCERNTFYLNLDEFSGKFAIMDTENSTCYRIDLEDFSDIQNVPVSMVGECVPLGEKRLLVSDTTWFGRRLRLLDLDQGRVLKKRSFIDYGFMQISVDRNKSLFFAPMTLTGLVRVLDLQTFAEVGRFNTVPGVRSVLLDPNNPDRLYSWSYFSGRVNQHRLPDGAITRTWKMGPFLRTLTWDCGARSLLAATSLGGFRIRLDD